MKKIGIIGGMSPESTLYYYKKFIEISREKFGLYFYPELIIYSINFKEFKDNPDGWEGRKRILINAAKALERAGAEVIGIAANTPHMVFSDVQRAINVEMVSIIDAVAEEAKRRGLRKLLLLGTKTTMTMPFYKEALKEKGFDVIVPNEDEIEEINRILFEEFVFGNFKSKPYLLDVIEKYMSEQDIEGVILGCTELPLAIKPEDVSAEVLDTAEIHVRALIEKALG
ncbi:aspartate/glutamate racemase family protein [Thermococcus sp. M39]|nr:MULTISPECIES: aspartate/glutamate racemase family protein [unclassified Thermococcus]NJE08701.1 aspartate/glutamate racemase family protein [Thermococcus sp. M39]NJE12997.1 aspartate/glutamate racemase family protein [Thermococcus sp. LS2]